VLVLSAVAALAAGCGAGKPSAGASVADCLNGASFLVQTRGKAVEGQSPAGVAFTLTLYPGPRAAQAAAAEKPAKTTAVVGRGLVDVSGNPRPYAGGQGVRMSRVELADVGRCIRKARG
jgi:hypothetical protein